MNVCKMRNAGKNCVLATCLVLLCASPAGGGVETPNLLPNPGFETEGLAGWYTYNVEVWEQGGYPAHGGSKFAVLTAAVMYDWETGSGMPWPAGMHETFDLSPWASDIDAGTATIRAGGYFDNESLDHMTVSFSVAPPGGGGASLSYGQNIGSGSWTTGYELVAFTNAIPAGCRTVEISITGDLSGMYPGDQWGYGFCDDVFVHISTERQPRWASIVPQSGGIGLQPANLLNGASYSVLATTNLAQGVWNPVTNFTAATSQPELVLPVDGAKSRFYKIQGGDVP